MKKTLLLLVALITATIAFAQTEIDGIYYYLNNSNQTAEVTYNVIYSNTEYSGDITIPEKVTYNATEYSVTSIGVSAFSQCSHLTSITIPNSVTSIESNAFSGCRSLTSITIPNNVTSIGDGAFDGCSSLTSITIGNSVNSIGNGGFYGCLRLKSIQWNAENYTDIFSTGSPFAYTKTITSFTFGDQVKHIPNYLCSGLKELTTITIPNSVTSIGKEAFRDCSSITSITMGNNITSIGTYAFWNCKSLTSITIPNNVTYIGDNPFYGCSSITSIQWNAENYTDDIFLSKSPFDNITSQITSFTFGDNVQHIPAYLCYEMNNLTSISIPENVTYIGKSAFFGCSNINKVHISDVAKWCNIQFLNKNSSPLCETNADLYLNEDKIINLIIPDNVHTINKYAFNNCSSIASVIIENNVTSIGYYAFLNCSSLTSITIPNSVTSIESNAFSGCRSLTSITIPNSVTSIGESAFLNCSSLTSIAIPNSVTSIEESTFSNCSSLTSVIIGNNVTSIGESAFSNCSSLASIIIGNKVTSIKNKTFDGCTSITSIQWNAKSYSNFTSASTSPFYNLRTQITSFTFGDNVQHIPAYLCYEMNNLTSISIPENITYIGGYAFYGCSNINKVYISDVAKWCNIDFDNDFSNPLFIGYFYNRGKSDILYLNGEKITNLIIPNNVHSINDYAFINCTSLTSVTIGNNVTYIENDAFIRCSSLDTITCLGNTPPTTNNIGGVDTNTCILFVPKEAHNNYLQHSYWKRFKTIRNIGYKEISISVNNSVWGKIDINGVFKENEEIILTAIPNKGYHFVKWNDDITDNPRTIMVTQDSTFTAIFEPDTFTISSKINEYGTIKGIGKYSNGDTTILTAIPNENYHFLKWSDGNTDNPRTIIVTQDSVFSAEFAINTYYITITKSENGRVTGVETHGYPYGTSVTLKAIANDGYKFKEWSDGNTDNPRTIIVTKDSTFTAEFTINTYNVTITKYENGTIIGAGTYDYGTEVTLIAIPNDGYKFKEWSDGNTDNPRKIIIEKNIELGAIFELEGTPVENTTNSNISIFTTDNTLHVEGATSDYHILDAAGRLIYSGNATTLTLPRGIYLITMGGEVEKIVL